MVQGGSSPITVLLCEDSLGFRMLASAWLDDAADIDLVAVAETGNEAVEMASRLLPQVVLLDHLLPDADSSTLVTVRSLKTLKHSLKLLTARAQCWW